MVEANAGLAASWRVALADRDLAGVRDEVRRCVAGVDVGRPLIVTGHQPEFIHPGVWAKHVVAVRLAEAVGGTALNLIVDCDRPRQAYLTVPSVCNGRLVAARVTYAKLDPRATYESIPRLTAEECASFAGELQTVMGSRFDGSMLGVYCRALASAQDTADYVDQAVAARRAVEHSFGVDMLERRASRCWLCPLLVEILANAGRFHACYNAALGKYRQSQNIRGNQRPIPDLMRDGPRLELPLWVIGPGGARQRLMVEPHGQRLVLWAGAEQAGELDAALLRRWDTACDAVAQVGDVAFRPRALTLTLWARMLLADLFIHGIGGAKYDRITDLLIEDYFGVIPPAMACVSATLWLDLPHHDVSSVSLGQQQRRLRELRYNPQRILSAEPDLAKLIEARARAVRRSDKLRSTARGQHLERRAVFEEIRGLNEHMLAAHPELLHAAEQRLQRTRAQLEENHVAAGREYFFALFDGATLQGLCGALPPTHEFRV